MKAAAARTVRTNEPSRSECAAPHSFCPSHQFAASLPSSDRREPMTTETATSILAAEQGGVGRAVDRGEHQHRAGRAHGRACRRRGTWVLERRAGAGRVCGDGSGPAPRLPLYHLHHRGPRGGRGSGGRPVAMECHARRTVPHVRGHQQARQPIPGSRFTSFATAASRARGSKPTVLARSSRSQRSGRTGGRAGQQQVQRVGKKRAGDVDRRPFLLLPGLEP